jgi:hypothetical protein
MNISRCSQSQTTLNRSPEVCEYVSKEVVAYDHVILRWIKNHEHRHRIDILMICLNLWILPGNLFEYALPEISAEALDVRLVSHRHASTSRDPGIFESRDDNSFHAPTSIQFLLRRDLVTRSLF